MEAPIKKAWLAQVAFPITQFAVFALISYISIYKFGNYDPKFGPKLSFKIHLYLIAFETALTSLLYSMIFLLNIHSIWNQIKALSYFKLSLPIITCALIQIGLYFPFEKIGVGIGLWLWLFLTPPALAWFSLKFIADEQQPEIKQQSYAD